MPDIRVQDEQGTVHVFPDGSTPEMIAKAMNVKLPAPQGPNPTTANNSIENAAPKPYYGFTPSNLYQNAKRGVSELGSSLYGAGKDALFPQGQTEGERLKYLAKKYVFDPADAENQKAQTAKTPWESVGHSIAAAVPVFGPWAAGLGEQAGTGDVGGAFERGATQVVAGELVKPVSTLSKQGIGMAREGLRNASFKELPTNGPQLVKGAARTGRAVGTIAGGGLGAATGIPGGATAGGIAGFELGPSLMEKVLGTPELGDIRNPGPFSKVPWGSKMKPSAPAPPVRTSPFEGMQSSANPGGENLQLPWAPKESTPFPLVKSKAQATGSAAEPFEPLIYESPEEAASLDFRKQNLKRQASAAGTYHAAQGAAGKRTNLQQRIQRKIESEQ